MNKQNSLRILKTILYVLAGLVLALGLLIGISLMISSGNVDNLLLPFMLIGSDAITNLMAPLLTSLISGLGIAVLIVSLVLSLLLYATGRLLAYIASLETRLAHMEARG